MDYKICIRTVTFSKHETNSYALSVGRVMYVQNATGNMCKRGPRKAIFTLSTHSYHILHVSKPTSSDDFDGSKKKNHNTICVGQNYMQTNTKNVSKT
jgi:hypothetical protein